MARGRTSTEKDLQPDYLNSHLLAEVKLLVFKRKAKMNQLQTDGSHSL